jgi:hypothetical protein
MEWYDSIEQLMNATIGPNQERYYSKVEGFFVAEKWVVHVMAEEGREVFKIFAEKVTVPELACDWGIMRTGGVAESFHGTKSAAIEHVRYLNATDEQGSSEIVTHGMTSEEASAWLAEMTR